MAVMRKHKAILSESLRQECALPAPESGAYLPQARAFLTWALEHLAPEMISVGSNPRTLNARKDQAINASVFKKYAHCTPRRFATQP